MIAFTYNLLFIFKTDSCALYTFVWINYIFGIFGSSPVLYFTSALKEKSYIILVKDSLMSSGCLRFTLLMILMKF